VLTPLTPPTATGGTTIDGTAATSEVGGGIEGLRGGGRSWKGVVLTTGGDEAEGDGVGAGEETEG